MLEAMEERGSPLGVVSAAYASVVEAAISALGLGGRFAFMVGSARCLAISRWRNMAGTSSRMAMTLLAGSTSDRRV